MTDEYTVDRRTVLQGTAAVILGSGLAGCSEQQNDSGSNTYDYPFVAGDDLARDIHRYEGEDIATQTTVEWTGNYIDHGPEARRYIAHPDGTDQVFDVLDNRETDAIRSVLGDNLDTDAHEDVPLQLYGRVDYIGGNFMASDPDASGDDYQNFAFVVDDAERLDTADRSVTNTTAVDPSTNTTEVPTNESDR